MVCKALRKESQREVLRAPPLVRRKLHCLLDAVHSGGMESRFYGLQWKNVRGNEMAEFGRLTVVAIGPGSARRFEVLLTGVDPALSAFAIPTLCRDLLFKVLERLQSYK